MQPTFTDVVNIGPRCYERFIDIENAPEISSVGIELAGCSNLSGEYVVGRVMPPNHTLFYSLNGTGMFRTPAGNLALNEGELIVLPAKQSFEVSITCEQWDIIWLNLSDCHTWQAFAKEKACVVQHAALEGLHFAMESLYLENAPQNRQAALHIATSYLYRLCDKLRHSYMTEKAQEHRPKTLHANRLNALFAAIDKQLQFDWNIERLCEKAHYSAPHLHRLCLQAYGRSPMQQVIHMRMQRAKSLLKSTQWPVSYIASYVGYANVFTFSTRFKKSVGMSPTTFRSLNT